MESRYRQLRQDLKKARQTTENVIQTERRRMSHDERPWPIFDYDVKNYINELDAAFPEITYLEKKFSKLKKQGKRILVVDICGAANAGSIGADKTIDFTLTRPNVPFKMEQTILEGDILSKDDVNSLFKRIDVEQTPIQCGFFKPVMGLADHEQDIHMFSQLYSVLKGTYDRLDIEGDIYAQSTILAMPISVCANALNAVSRVPFCHPSTDSRSYAASWHIKKYKKGPSELPSFKNLKMSDEDKLNMEDLIRAQARLMELRREQNKIWLDRYDRNTDS